jgi:hypothetical protein
MTDGKYRCSVGKPEASGRVAYFSLAGCRRTIDVHIAKPLITKKDLSVGTENLHVSVEEESRLRMAVIVLAQQETILRREIEQTLDGFQVFDFCVMELIAQLPILEYARAADINSQHHAEDTDIPKREPIANKPWS